eukprot:317862_1
MTTVPVFEESEDGLDELISLILPEIDEEIENNPAANELLNDSPTSVNAEEYHEYKQDINISNILNNNSIEWLNNSQSLPMFANPFENNIVENNIDFIKEIETELNEIDDDNNGLIDLSEFSCAIESIDNTIIYSEIEAIYDFIINKYQNNNEIETEINDELNIKIFINYLKKKKKNIMNIKIMI